MARDDARARQTVEPPLSGGFSRGDMLALLALGLLVVVSYLPAMLWGGFVWDDRIITNSEPVREVSGLWQIWFAPSAIGEEGHYWPLVYTTFWLEHKLWGYAPVGYHVVNVLLHLANALLLWHVMRRLAVSGAWMVAAVFAVHPLHVESVAWVIERKDVLSGLFYLAAVLAWMRFVEQPNPRRYACSLALYAAALLSKSIAITLPAALLIWHWWKQGRVTSMDLLRLVPFFVIGLVITVGDLSFYQSVEPLSLGYSLTERTLIAARALWFYTGKLLWPIWLGRHLSALGHPRRRPAGLGVSSSPLSHWWRLSGVSGISLGADRWRGRCFLRLRYYRFWASSITAICSMRLSPTVFSTSPALGSWPSSSARSLMASVAYLACGKRVCWALWRWLSFCWDC